MPITIHIPHNLDDLLGRPRDEYTPILEIDHQARQAVFTFAPLDGELPEHRRESRHHALRVDLGHQQVKSLKAARDLAALIEAADVLDALCDGWRWDYDARGALAWMYDDDADHALQVLHEVIARWQHGI
ncbi:hypothetical protein [Nonomuraea sp. NPDC050786]|uniref:hypothetical protein n=1 Tax=Nonomuraea sp. NPDC050786 TaxID=3154840 RepID=UPI0033E0FB9D